jgi:hypothetical protein
MCGAMNPVQNAYCDQCNARIVPMTAPSEEKEPEREQPAIRGLSLPTISLDEQPSSVPPQEQEAKKDTGDWLTQLRDSTDEGEMETPTTEEEEKGTEDWLGQLRESAEASEEGEDWLAQLRDSAGTVEDVPTPESEATAEPIEPTEIPDWLRDLGPVGVEEQQPSVEAAQRPEAEEAAPEMPVPAEVPDWLQGLAPEEAAAPAAGVEPATQMPEAEEVAPEMPVPAEVPDWLQGLAPEEAAAPAAGVEPATQMPEAEEVAPEMPAPAEVPDWLQGLAPEEAAAPAAGVEPAIEEAAPEMPAPAEVPDWLQGLAPEEAAAPAAGVEPAIEEAAPEMPSPAEVPDWLQGLAPEEAAAPAAGVEPAAQEALPEMPSPAEVPDWLRDMAPEEAASAQRPEAKEAALEMPPPTPPFIGEPLIAETEAPDWLTELKQRPTPSMAEDAIPPFAVEPDTVAAEAAGLARAEIPAWLEAMRPTAEVAEEAPEEEPAETEGLLQGLRGVLSPLPMIDVTHARESALPAEIGQAALARAQLLQSLLTRPTEAPQPKARKRAAGMSELVPRLLIAVVLLVVVGGLLLISQDPAFDSQIPSLAQPDTSSIANMYNLIAGVNEGETVVVVVEYGPTNADELNPVARAILEHLMERKANISIATTQPEGLAVAEALRSEINAQEQVVSGQRPVLEYAKEAPGYRPGNATGISQILASIDTRPTMIIVLTAQPESLRWWIEQTRAHYGAASPPIAAGVSAALEIASSPYLDANANQLKGIVSGLGGAVAYQIQRGTAAQTPRQLDALAAGHLVIVASMLVGAVLYAAGGLHRRGK